METFVIVLLACLQVGWNIFDFIIIMGSTVDLLLADVVGTSFLGLFVVVSLNHHPYHHHHHLHHHDHHHLYSYVCSPACSCAS